MSDPADTACAGAAVNITYAAYAARLLDTGLVVDPWVDGAPRFREAPLALAPREHDQLNAAAERVTAALHEVVTTVARHPRLLDTFFALTPTQKLLWQSSAPLWHGIARADAFFVADGDTPTFGTSPRARVVVCEINADTPSGHAEAIALSATAGIDASRDPNRELERRWTALLAHFLAHVNRAAPGHPATVGIVYPTEIAGDHALIRLYQTWCARAGLHVVLGSPFNLHATADGGVAMFGITCDLIVRHYKTDWWAERLPIWDDEAPYPDPEPLRGPIATLLSAVINRRCAVVNPFASVLAQNKRAFAFLWEHLAQLSPDAQATVRAHVPETLRLERADFAVLQDHRDDWVLKSDYGCEGEEVLIGAGMTADEWGQALARAIPQRWVAQRRFSPRLDQEGQQTNHGVYVVGGKAAGLYTRLSHGATDISARSVPVEIQR